MKKLISWVEIPATNIERATGFYNRVLKLDLEIMDFGKEKMACFPEGEGAIVHAPDINPSENGVLVSFEVEDDLEQTLKVVADNGGKIVKPKTKVEAEGKGYFALFVDTEGNKLGLYSD